MEKGYGRCNLIKGDYYYFTIGNNKSGKPFKAGDLLYTMIEKTGIYYGKVAQVAGHLVRLLSVYDVHFYEPAAVFSNWNKQQELAAIDSFVADIRFTGKYFLEHDPSMDKNITTGIFKGKTTLHVMADCQSSYVTDFLGYMIAHPRLYAGRDWKVSEIFATWLSEGAPR